MEEKDKEVKEDDLPVIEEGIQEEERAEELEQGEPDRRDDHGERRGDEEIAREECGEPKPPKVIVKVIPLPEGENGAGRYPGHLHSVEKAGISCSASSFGSREGVPQP